VANRWFATRRGFVVGLFSAGWSAGQFIFIPIMMGLTLAFGWRSSLVLLVAIMGLVVLPLSLLFVRNQPSEVGLQPYGAEHSSAAATADRRVTPISSAVRTWDFWLLAGSYFVCGFTTNGLIGTHLIPHAVEHGGFSETVAAGALGTLGLMNIVGTTASGWLTDRYDPRRLLAFIYGFRALGLLMLPWVSDLTSLSIFVVIYGLDWIATVPPTVALTADRFGRGSIGLLFGWISLSHQVGGAVASYFGGLARVWLGDYQVAFLAAALLAFIAAAICQLITAPSRAAPAPATA
jgi:predicted MFS family arabinose efflux permease